MAVVRRLIGHQRLDTPAQLAWLDRLVGQRTRKVYGRPTSPLRRVLDSGGADPARVAALVQLYTTTSRRLP